MRRERLPWHKEYRITGIQETLRPYPDKPAHEMLYITAKKYKKNGLIQGDYKMPYPEVRDKVDRLATSFYNIGLRKGERVATILPTSIQFILADYAISRAGLVHVPGSALEPLSVLEHKFREGTPSLLITLDEHAALAGKLAKKCGIEGVIFCSIDEYSSSRAGDSAVSKKGVPKNSLWMKELIEGTPPTPPDLVFDVEKDIETLIFTGGTTGLPKGCMLTHRNIYSNVLQNAAAFGKAGQLIEGAITQMVGLPLFHSYGHVSMHTITLYGHNQILVPDPRNTEEMIRMIKTHFPVVQVGVPTQFMKLSDELEGYGMIGISGSAPLPSSAQDKFEKKAGGGIMEGYGLSEMSPCTHLNTTFLVRVFGGRLSMRIRTMLLSVPGVVQFINAALRLIGPRNVGRLFVRLLGFLLKRSLKKKLAAGADPPQKIEKRGAIGVPYPDTEVKFLSPESSEDIPLSEMLKGARGEMLLRGPQRMLGYWPEPGSGIDPEGYIHTGDVVRIDKQGCFYIVDRTKDMIIVSGYKVYSRELDDILDKHPKVEIAAVVGVPDPRREGSERIVAYVQPREKSRNDVTKKEIIDYLRERVAKYAVPAAVLLVDEMPLTEVQKVNKKLLREMAAKNADVQAAVSGSNKIKKPVRKLKTGKK